MKNKIAIIVLIIAIVAILGGIGFYFIQKNKAPANSLKNTTPPSQTGTNNQVNSEQSQNKLVTDDFEISLPEGWQKTAPAIGASAMAIKADEQLTDPAAQKINFRSYFAVSYDTLQGKSLSEYLQSVKIQLQQTISGAVFAQEHDTTINGKPARAFEASFTQQGVNFKILMVVVKGVNDDVWVISFNTLQSTWAEYQKAFSDIANSFSLKLKK
ncbi:MAG: hypothetical protein A2469_03160 [Candidatus Magasanikbacteria bacterium RIFOXYC2_FULL_40_16]|uniref:PsbP C-terminal domain-containing protein n=1 Tax=Candidatus Magasanikbacteria bacterium RIFOXYC2_FULL_40_16 TaxID=1798703 RepID=A0A1F6NZP4_9BACT|nr:MAG: hypothetical protein A2224_03850 [Candidatus Magasanikbacteria bacterium RIFOXYA2_FULL_40_20]OGH85290.1 MAG: hypothetical protein A2301_02690 [Candidatus Magasanikbacteria bacterium RIFOXYB2_FULL_40_13]OGH89397.1 MAG: hypothetical protein A2469_03160 [Candidatus Magasanikbacteria bacterium RIFOXYC2_FULL_40_16]